MRWALTKTGLEFKTNYISTQGQALKNGYPSSGLVQDIPSYDEYKAGLKY